MQFSCVCLQMAKLMCLAQKARMNLCEFSWKSNKTRWICVAISMWIACGRLDFLASGERKSERPGRRALSLAAVPCRISLQWIKGLREFYAIQATARCHRPRSCAALLGHASAHYAGPLFTQATPYIWNKFFSYSNAKMPADLLFADLPYFPRCFWLELAKKYHIFCPQYFYCQILLRIFALDYGN